MVYVCTDNIDLEESLAARMSSVMPPERIARANRYRRKKDRDLCILSYQILRYAIGQTYAPAHMPEIKRTPKGKPYFADACCEFNLSHCDSGIAVAVSGEKIGVDLQEPVSFIGDVKSHFLSPAEMQHLHETPHTSADLLKLWTLKEAYGKCRGDGLIYPFRETNLLPFLQSDSIRMYDDLYGRSLEYGGCALSIFAERQEDIEIRDVGLRDLITFLQL